MTYFETSAATGTNVEDAVVSLLGRVMVHVQDSSVKSDSSQRITLVNGDTMRWSKCDVDEAEIESEKSKSCSC